MIMITCTVVFVLGCNWAYLAVVKHENKLIELNYYYNCKSVLLSSVAPGACLETAETHYLCYFKTFRFASGLPWPRAGKEEAIRYATGDSGGLGLRYNGRSHALP
jgi:hypothetical protein